MISVDILIDGYYYSSICCHLEDFLKKLLSFYCTSYAIYGNHQNICIGIKNIKVKFWIKI